MIPAAVARRYAKALLSLGEESGQLEALVAELARAAQTYEASAELRSALENPLVPHEAKKGILTELAQRLLLSATAKNTLLLLGDRRRIRALPAIVQQLHELNDLRRGVIRAEVVSARPLPAAYYDRLRQQLERITGKKVVLDTREDPALLAGVVARVGDRVYDGSLRTRLGEMRAQLLPN